MTLSRQLLITAAWLSFSLTSLADPLFYVVTGSPTGAGTFGVLNSTTGSFTRIGGDLPGTQGLVPTSDGSLLTLTFAGDLARINPTTGAFTDIGPTGLSDCSVPGVSPCGPRSSFSIAAVGGQAYITDFSGNLYRLNTQTGTAVLATATGIPALPFTPGIPMDADGSFGITDQGLFGANGKLYSTFDVGVFNPTTLKFTSVVDPVLYQIDPASGQTTSVGTTLSGIGAVTADGGSYYAFNDLESKIYTLDLGTGNTTFVSGFDPAVGVVTGASIATPEPAGFTLTGVAFVFLVLCIRRRIRHVSCSSSVAP